MRCTYKERRGRRKKGKVKESGGVTARVVIRNQSIGYYLSIITGQNRVKVETGEATTKASPDNRCHCLLHSFVRLFICSFSQSLEDS